MNEEAAFPGATLLLVEDDPLVAANTQRALESRGYRVVATGGAAAALERIPAEQPDLAVVDIDLGKGGSGAVLAREILARHGTPIVFHTGHIDAQTVAQISDIEHFGYVTKDAGPDVLDQIISMALRLSREIHMRREREAQVRHLMQESHARTRADMDLVRSMLAVQRFRSPDGQTQSALYSAEQHLTLLQRIYEQVYREEQSDHIPLPHLVERLLQDLQQAQPAQAGRGPHRGRPDISSDIESVTVGRVACVPVGIIVLELVSNALRHAFRTESENPVVHVEIRMTREAWLEISVHDNGVGMPSSYLMDDAGYGLALVSTLAEQFSGALRLESERNQVGTTVCVLMQLPLASGEPAK